MQRYHKNARTNIYIRDKIQRSKEPATVLNPRTCNDEGGFTQYLTSQGIEHRTTLPMRPQTNGMVERVNGIIKQNTVKKKQYKTEKEMADGLFSFLQYYNFSRVHQNLRKEMPVETPIEALEKIGHKLENSSFLLFRR